MSTVTPMLLSMAYVTATSADTTSWIAVPTDLKKVQFMPSLLLLLPNSILPKGVLKTPSPL